MARRNAAARVPRSGPPVERLERALEAARRFLRASRSPATYRAYAADWRTFLTFCAQVGASPLPASPGLVAAFISEQAESNFAASTISRRLSAIRLAHIGAKLEPPHEAPEVIEAMRGIRRTIGRKPVGKAPLLPEDLQLLVDASTEDSLDAVRDRALLLVGFAGALRRSELVALRVEHLTHEPQGVVVTIPRSKTDQEGAGETVTLLREPESIYCPVAALQDWLQTSGITDGAVFRRLERRGKVGARVLTPQSVSAIVKSRAEKAGLDSTQYSAHSLRSGFLTAAARNRASIFKMAEQSRHKSFEVLRRYVRDAERFVDHAGAGLLASRRRAR